MRHVAGLMAHRMSATLTPLAFIKALVLFSLLTGVAAAQTITIDKEDQGKFEPKAFALPYVFTTDSTEEAVGAAFGTKGYLQKQYALIGSAIASANETYALFLISKNFRVPYTKRLFVDPYITFGTFGEIESYTDGNPDFPNEQAGSNNSSKDNFITSEGEDQWYRLTIKYILPIGDGLTNPIETLTLDKGLLIPEQEEVQAWNPLETGRTYLEMEPFFREIDSDSAILENNDDAARTAGIEFGLRYENIDFPSNPSRGSEQKIGLARDWGAMDSSAPWTVWEAESAKYFSLGESEWFRQQVIALNFWTADTPTWDSSHVEDDLEIFHRPPYYAGATLGGVHRLRGYPSNRFNDQAAIHYTAEYRVIPHWHPLGEVEWLNFLQIDWWQWVAFADVGRVADHYAFDELHSKMKWDLGIALRAMVKHLVLRAEVGVSEEDVVLQMFVGHPFPQ